MQNQKYGAATYKKGFTLEVFIILPQILNTNNENHFQRLSLNEQNARYIIVFGIGFCVSSN